jgi:hypothetical protein
MPKRKRAKKIVPVDPYRNLRLMGVAQKWMQAECEIADRANDYYSENRLKSLRAAVEFALWTREVFEVKDA